MWTKFLKDSYGVYFWERIGFRIAIGFLVPIGFNVYTLISVAGFSGLHTGIFSESMEKKEWVTQKWTNVHAHELEYHVKIFESKYEVARYLGSDNDASVRHKAMRLLKEVEQGIRNAQALSGDSQRPESMKIYMAIFTQIEDYSGYLYQLGERRKSDKKISRKERESIRRRMLLLSDGLEQAVQRLTVRFEALELQDQDSIKASFSQILNGLQLMLLVTIFLGLTAVLLVTWNVTRPMKLVVDHFRDIVTGEGGLTKRVSVRAVGEMAEISRSMNDFLDKTYAIVSTIRDASQIIASSVSEVKENTDSTALSAIEINRNMMTQSMNLEDCSVSVSRIDELLHSSDESSRQAASLSRLAMERALRGGGSVQETVQAMGKIEESATKVDVLVSTINGLATQTNLLAINAAIEASKAGEHGKGFAVVAEEVRKLAARTGKLTGEVNDLISETSERVKVGSELARGAGVALDGVIKDVEAVASLIQRIANASTKQAESSSRFLDAIQKINSAVRDNLGSMQFVTRGAEVVDQEIQNLEGMVSRLNNLVNQFHLQDYSYAEYGKDSKPGLARIPVTEPDSMFIDEANGSNDGDDNFFSVEELKAQKNSVDSDEFDGKGNAA